MTTKHELAAAQLGRLIAAGLPVGLAAFDEVYTRSGKLREACETAGLTYVGIVPRDFAITLASGAVIRADEAVKEAVFERRSCGTGTKGIPGAAVSRTSAPNGFYRDGRRLYVSATNAYVPACLCLGAPRT